MNALSDFETDEHALVKRPRPIGWFFAGLGVVATLVITFAYYMPVSSAHGRLVGEYETLAQKSRELDNALKKSQKEFKATDAQRGSLRTFVDQGAQAAETNLAALNLGKATAENELAAFVSAKLLTVEVDERGLVFSFKDAALFRGTTANLSPRARHPVCKAVSGLGAQKEWVVRPVTLAPSDDTKYWEIATERAGNLASLLEKSCKVAPDRILATASGAGSKNSEEGYTDLIVGPLLSPQVDFKKAPAPMPPPSD